MKKMVARVMAAVMVMGLATVAFGATKVTTYEGLYSQDANVVTATESDVTITVNPAKAVKYDKDGNATAMGQIEYVTADKFAGEYVFVNTLADADVVLYKDAAMKQVKFYLAKVDGVEYYEAAAFTNFGEKCGQVDYADYDKDVKYYTVKGLDFVVVAEDKTSTDFVMVGGKMVPVSFVADETDVVAHTAVYEMKDGEIVSIECGACGVKAVKAANALSVPKGADVVVDNWYWAATAAATTETVESAKTFDAGVAMYVGMSVMAAAGSAVVLKKKD